MKILFMLLLFLFTSLASVQSSVNDDASYLSIENQPTQTMLMSGEHVQCDGICVACMAIQSTIPTLQHLTLALTSYIFVNAHYYSLHEPVLTPPPTV